MMCVPGRMAGRVGAGAGRLVEGSFSSFQCFHHSRAVGRIRMQRRWRFREEKLGNVLLTLQINKMNIKIK